MFDIVFSQAWAEFWAMGDNEYGGDEEQEHQEHHEQGKTGREYFD